MTTERSKTDVARWLFVPAALVLAACGAMAPPASPPDEPDLQPIGDIPAAIAAPSGSTLATTLKGSGVQHYECRAKGDAAGGHDWLLVAPEAVLRDRSGAIAGRHYVGPTWEYGDGSKVVGKVLASTPAPTPGNLPWLLLQGTSSGPSGFFSGVTRVQRVATSGGTAPSDPCTRATAGAKSTVRYSATYLFYKG